MIGKVNICDNIILLEIGPLIKFDYIGQCGNEIEL